jgi:hypothetical protein
MKEVMVKEAKIEKAEVQSATINKAEVKKLEAAECCKTKTKKGKEIRSAPSTPATKPQVPAATKAAEVTCPAGKCWPDNPAGKYHTAGTFEGATVKVNEGNMRWQENTVSAKLQLHGSWGPEIVVRNPTESVNHLLEPLRQEIKNHLAKIKGRPPVPGASSCYEKSWIPRSGKWTVLSDQS